MRPGRRPSRSRRRRAPARFDLASYGEGLDRFLRQVAEAYYRQLAGLEEGMGLEAIYAEHAALFDARAITSIRRLAEGDSEEAAQARALLAFAVEQHLSSKVADLTERIASSESQAVVVWRGQRIPYRDVWNRATDIAHRAERNALAASYNDAVQAINPLREER